MFRPAPGVSIERISAAEWRAEGRKRFGPGMLAWRFRCPVCGLSASAADWKDAGAPEVAVAYSCVGRWRDQGSAFGKPKGSMPLGCDYAGGGLFCFNPVHVIGEGGKVHPLFAFADPE